MNTEIESLEPHTGSKRRRGRVARLPKILRDKVNAMLDDGATYGEIVTAIANSTDPAPPYPITEQHITRWKEGGYQDYLRNQAWADAVRDRQDKFLEVAAENPVKLADAGMQLAATGICELLDELSRLQSSDENAADKYARITNAMTRLARVILTYEQHRQAVAEKQASQSKLRDPNKPFGDEDDHRAVVRVVDHVLGIDRFKKQMMEADAAAGRPWPSQIRANAAKNAALATSADGAPG